MDMMLSIQTRNAYSEVFELMKYVDRNDLDKIPMDILSLLKENRNKEYVPQIDFENMGQSISRKALALYIGLYKKYIVQDKSEVQEINKILYENEIKKSNSNEYNVFEKVNIKEESKTESMTDQKKEIVPYKEGFIHRIINKFKLIFKSGGEKGGC